MGVRLCACQLRIDRDGRVPVQQVMARPQIHLCASSLRMREAGQLLATVMRRPDLQVIENPSQCTNGRLIMLDPEDACPAGSSHADAPYRLVPGTVDGCPVECRLAEGLHVTLPDTIDCIQEDNGYLAEMTMSNRAKAMLSIAWRRFRKSSNQMSGDDLLESHLCSVMFRRVFGKNVQAEFEAWLRLDGQASFLQHAAIGRFEGDLDDPYLREMISECLGNEVSESYFENLDRLTSVEEVPDMGRIMSRPSIVAHAALALSEEGESGLTNTLGTSQRNSETGNSLGMRLESWLPNCRNAKQLCAIGFAAIVLKRQALLEKVVQIIQSGEWVLEDSVLLPLVPGKANIERSLLASGFVAALAMRMEGASFSSLLPRNEQVSIQWEGFGSQQPESSIEGTSLRFFDPERRRISVSLLDNWLKLIEQPDIRQGQLCISDSRYEQTVEAIEMVWGRIIDAIATEAGQPVVRTRPWPRGTGFAVSVRYDVDRPVPEGNIDRILDIQNRAIGGMCGSWFFIEGAEHNEPVRESIDDRGQEEGLHSTRLTDESCKGLGVTAHSSQYSQYFHGRTSLLDAEAGGALYAEQMNHLATAPRPAWLGDRASVVWAFPLHFPVEGSITEQDLSYFERYAKSCVRQKKISAHIVLGAHPDCRPELVRLAVEHCGLEGGWAVPMKDVLARIQSLSTPGNIRVEIRDEQVTAWSRNEVKDVVFEFIPPGGDLLVLHGDLKAGEFVTLHPMTQ